MPTRHLKHLLLSILVMLMMPPVTYSKDISFEVVSTGLSTGLKGGATYILRSDYELETFWGGHGRGDFPSVDFKKEMLVGVFSGKRPDPSYRIRIKSIDESNEWVKVIYSEKEARSDNRMRVYPLIMVDPFVVIKIKKTDKFIIFEEER